MQTCTEAAEGINLSCCRHLRTYSDSVILKGFTYELHFCKHVCGKNWAFLAYYIESSGNSLPTVEN